MLILQLVNHHLFLRDTERRGEQTARKAVEAGVAGVIVSNHGGRQLDYAPATISVLEEVY